MKTKWILTLLGICYISNLAPAFAGDVLERAKILGHSVKDIKAGKIVSSVVTVKSLEQLKSLSMLCQSTSPAVADTVTTSDETKTEFSGLQDKAALQKKLDAHLFKGRSLTDDEKATINRVLFPLTVYTESSQNVIYSSPTLLNQTPTSYLYYNYGTVTLNNNASVTVQSSPLCYAMDTLVKNSTPPSGSGDFNVVGIDGQSGAPGQPGSPGTAGSPGYCGCLLHGHGGPCDPGQPGQSNGSNGTTGGQGAQGTPSEAATLYISGNIQTTVQNVIFQTSTGVGGNGGAGGIGGAGGDGGQGGTGGVSRYNYCCYSAIGGAGGNGKSGGNGGDGGVSLRSNGDVSIYVLDQYIDSPLLQLNSLTVQSTGGAAGQPGPAGAGGPGGAKPPSDGCPGGHGSRGPSGSQGSPGQPGTPGNSVPSAQIHLFPI